MITFNCDDCGICTREEYYMVHDRLWPRDAFLLCIGCLERRLGRMLRKEDFKARVMKRMLWFNVKRSKRLKNRLGRPLAPGKYWK